jgi:hypothetical protein
MSLLFRVDINYGHHSILGFRGDISAIISTRISHIKLGIGVLLYGKIASRAPVFSFAARGLVGGIQWVKRLKRH